MPWTQALDGYPWVLLTWGVAGIEVRLLGPVVALVDGTPVDLTSGKQRALFARLALDAGERLSIDRLVDDLWGEQPPATARHALQVHVSNLRKLLGASAVGTERPGYVLRVPRESCDATRFESLALSGHRALQDGDLERASAELSNALALWSGPALSDLLFEPFAPNAAARLDELRIAAIEDRVIADLELGRHVEAAAELEALVVEHPLRERLRGALMLALYRSGRQVAALRTYQELRDRLRDELGLDPGPDLRQLETAILRHDASLAAPRPDRDRAPGTRAAPTSVNGERPETRRAATVVVAGLTGFDRAASALDPEDLRAILDRSASTLASVIDRYGGIVESTTGGELIAVFGAPTAHEDDPERAVRAARDVLRAVREDAELARLNVNVGVATGQVLFAASGPPEQRRFTVIGDVVNEARRLQARAPNDTIVVGPLTYGSTHKTVAYEDLGDATYAVVGIPGTRRSRPLGLTPFLGRDGELGSLLKTWDRTVAERRVQLVSILGEPGVGKSRILAEFQRATDGRRVVSGRCIPYGEALGYAPLADALREAAGASSEDPPAIVRSRLRDLVGKAATLGDDAVEIERHVALLTGLDDEHDRASGLADARTLHASTRRFLEALARAEPLCIAVEDVHWADDALLDLVEEITRRAKGVPLMFVTFARPELVERRPGWGGGVPGFTSLELEPLDPSSTTSLVAELGRAHSIADDVLERIATRSSGNPLFAEELVATVAEGDEGTGIPASLTSLLLARVDALPVPQQSALRHASVIGMTFWPSAIEALQTGAPIPGSDGADLAETIADLESRDLVRIEPRSALAGEVAYSFKHVLIRDAAYESLPRGQRRELHRAADAWLSEAAGDRVGEFSDQLAHHALASGEPERALDYLTTAADRSRRAASHRREIALLEQALGIADPLDRTELVADLHARREIALSRLTLWADVVKMNAEHRERLASDEWRKSLEEFLVPYTLGDLALADLGDHVLEVGPGPGLATDILRAALPKITAIELDAELATALRDRLAGTNVTVVNEDATRMPFADESFSGAAQFTMLHHVPTAELQDALFAEVLRVLRPGGLLIAADGVANDELEGMHADDIYNPIDPSTLADRLRAIGFTDVDVRSNSLVWACHARR
jgi:DNA-binding SARP family transcriptional activator/SAM-dependent methyltransferase